MFPVLLALLAMPLAAQSNDLSSRLPDVQGYLGLATVPKSDHKRYWWSPVDPHASVAIATIQLPSIAPQTWTAIAPNHREPLTYAGVQDVPYGCDDVATAMPLFSSARPLPEGPVLVIPAKIDVTGVALVSVPPKERPTWLPHLSTSPKEAQTWKLGDHWVVMQKQGQFGYQLSLYEGEREIYRQEGKKEFPFDGAEHTPVDLSISEPEVPKPMLGYRVAGRSRPSVVLFHAGYEGLGFSVLWPQNGEMRQSFINSIYWCAF